MAASFRRRGGRRALGDAFFALDAKLPTSLKTELDPWEQNARDAGAFVISPLEKLMKHSEGACESHLLVTLNIGRQISISLHGSCMTEG